MSNIPPNPKRQVPRGELAEMADRLLATKTRERKLMKAGVSITPTMWRVIRAKRKNRTLPPA